MKKLLLSLVAAVMAPVLSWSQLAPGSFGQDFTITDQFGETHNLYSYLDQGYTVFLDVSATWCGPCWNYHTSGALDEIYFNHGPSGAPGVSASTTDDAMVIWLDGDGQTDDATMTNGAGSLAGQVNWLNPAGTPIEFPMANPATALANQINDDYAIAYFPTIYRICPNRIVTEVGQAGAADLYASVGDCPAPASFSNDPLMLSYNGDVVTCGAVNVAVTIQNNGLTPLTACTITVTGGVAPVSYDWTGNLSTYAIDEVNVGTVNMTSAGNLQVSITSADDDASNNNYTASIGFADDATTRIRLEITFDNWPEEASWEITNDNGNVVASEAYSAANADGSSVVENVYLPSTGCYQLTWYDAYGDGLNGSIWGATDGSVLVTSRNEDGSLNSVLWDYDGSYGFYEAAAKANVNVLLGVGEVATASEFRVYPNPASDRVTFDYTLASSENVVIEMVDMVGNIVKVQNLGNMAAGANQSQITLDAIAAGIYMVNFKAGNSVSVSKLTVK